MSLVAYAASSDEDSDCESTEELNVVTKTISSALPVKASQGSISKEQQNGQQTSKSLNLPQPKHVINTNDDVDSVETNDLKLNLPAPKKSQAIIIEEKDDEFLHKTVQPSLIEKPTKPKPGVRQPVKITIPSLAELGEDDLPKPKLVTVGPNPVKPNSLLGMLPPPKFHAGFGKPKEKPDSASTPSTKPSITKTTSLVPHTVANRMKEAAAKPKPKAKPTATVVKKSSLGLHYNNSDDSDDEDEGGDFFSLNTEEKLPEVSASEINAMVAKKATQMAEFSKNLQAAEQNAIEVDDYAAQPSSSSSSSYGSNREDINIEALIGARAAKRSKKEDIQFIDISQDRITSSHDEWSRNQLQNETQFQPTGRLVTGDPGAGTKKKHQITYLAYQAKANEAELQAMWATNRQSRRQTQSKYGF